MMVSNLSRFKTQANRQYFNCFKKKLVPLNGIQVVLDKKMTSRDFFFELLKSGLWSCPSSFNGQVDWHQMKEMAKMQSVTGILFDGIQHLRKTQRPPTRMLLDWFGQTLHIESANIKHNQDLASLVDFLRNEGVDSRLLKGQGCASYYPNPLHRQCGDIDLFVGKEQYGRVLHLIESKGIRIEKDSVKDAHFIWRNTQVELHWIEEYFYSRRLNGRLQQIFRKEEWKNPKVIMVEGVSVAMLNPTLNVFHVFVHLWHHFLQVGVGLRQICDWMLILKRDECLIDWISIHKYVKRMGAERAWCAFYGLTVKYLGLELTNVPVWMQAWRDYDVDEIVKDVLIQGNFGQYGESIRRRQFKNGLIKNIGSFGALGCRLMRVWKFGRREVVAYPLWRLFRDDSMMKRYKQQKT